MVYGAVDAIDVDGITFALLAVALAPLVYWAQTNSDDSPIESLVGLLYVITYFSFIFAGFYKIAS